MLVPIFTYCSSVSLKHTREQLNKLHSLERRAATFIDPGNELMLPSTAGINKMRACQFVRQAVEKPTCENFHEYFQVRNHKINTRNNSYMVELPKMKTEFGKKSFMYMGAKLYNALPIHIRKEECFTKFKSLLKDHFISL